MNINREELVDLVWFSVGILAYLVLANLIT